MNDSGSGSSRSLRYALTLAALGVVFGDIGTSPLYALRGCFLGPQGIPINETNVIGSVSLIIWFLVIIVSIKYAIFVMRADNKGEGGILALMALVHRVGSPRIKKSVVISFFGILGAALLFSDGVLTPAISVLSAVEGLNVATPMFSAFIIPISIVVLAGLFAIQSFGTSKIGALFSPAVLIWFLTIGTLGFVSIFESSQILKAFNPYYAVMLIFTTGWKGFSLLGSAFLAVTGAEVLYADMGHFGKSPIRAAWFYIVFPALILNYMGQGAHLLYAGQTAENLFYQLSPGWFIYPLVIISTFATIIASQAVISGAFSLARQAVQLGFFPRMKVIHTSRNNIGQVYIPFINLALFVVTILLILGFKESGNLASAYGIAVSATMLITTVLILLLSRYLWKTPLYFSIPLGALILFIDGSLFAANLAKVLSGGWVVVFIAFCFCVLMTTWVAGRKILQKQVLSSALPLGSFVKDMVATGVVRTPKTAVFLSGNATSVPRALLHNFKHNGIIHQRTLIVSVITEDMPFVAMAERAEVMEYGQGVFGITLRYGFMESPDVPKELKTISISDLPKDMMQYSYFLGKESLIVTQNRAMRVWRKRIFLFMARNAQDASGFFRLPPNRVIELGVQIEF